MRQIKISKSITNRESPSLEKYLQEIGRVELLPPEEEVELAVKVKSGDQNALEKLIKSNLRFVVSVAKQYQNQGLSLADLINEGNLGLIKSALKFDETRGFKFISYAVWWIRQSILQALAEQSRIVRLPLNKVGFMNRIIKAFHELEQQFERSPTEQEIADFLQVDPDEVSLALNVSIRHISVDTPLADGEENTLLDVMVNENATFSDEKLNYQESLSKEIDRSLRTLSQKQKEIVCDFFGIGIDAPLSLEDIAEKFNLTRERVRQIKDKAISRLKSGRRSKLLRVYMG